MAKPKQLKFFNQSSFKVVKQELDNLLKDKKLRLAVFILFFLLGLNFLLLAVFWLRLPPKLPLFYSRPWGEDQLVNKNLFLLLPFSSLFFILLNLRIASFFFRKKLLLSQIFIWSSLVIYILASITLTQILIISL